MTVRSVSSAALPRQPVIEKREPGWQEAVYSFFRQIPTRVGEALFSASLLPQDPALKLKRLENGLTYYLRKNDYPYPGKANFHLVIRAGMLNEREDQKGIAHLIEHIAQIETAKFSKNAIRDYLHTKGVHWARDNNAYTSSQETVYQLEIPLDDPQALEKAIFILSQVASQATLSDETIENERDIVIDELKLRQSIGLRFQREKIGYLCEGTARPSLYEREKEIESVKTCPADTVRSFYRRWYRPENIAVIAVGDFDPEQTSRLIEKHFGKIPASPFPRSEHVETLKTDRGTHILSFSDSEITGSTFEIYHQLPLEKHEGILRRENSERRLASSLFISMLNRRLSDLTEEDDSSLIKAASSGGETIQNWPKFAISAQVKEGKIPQAIKEMIVELKRVKEFGFTKSEFERAKKDRIAHFDHLIREKGQTPSKSFIGLYQHHFMQNTAIPDLDEGVLLGRKILEGIDLKTVNAFSSHLLPETNALISVATPKKPGLAPITSQEIKQALLDASKEKITPFKDAVAKGPLLEKVPEPVPIAKIRQHKAINVTEYTLKNGLRVLVKPTTFEKDMIVIHAVSHLGTRDSPLKDRPSALFIDSFYGACGMGSFDRKTLRKMLQDKQVSLITATNRYASHIKASSTPQDLETLFQLLHILFTDQGYERPAFERELKQKEESLRNASNDPSQVFTHQYNALITEDHPEQRFLSLDDLKRIDYETCKEFHRKLYSNPADFTAVIVGNVQKQKIKDLIERYLASIPGTGEKTERRDYPPIPFPQGIIRKRVSVGKAPGALSALTFPSSTQDTYKDHCLSSWCCQILELRLNHALRFEMGKTYSQSCSHFHAGIPGLSKVEPTIASLWITGDPALLESLEKKALEQIRDLQENGPAEAEVSDLKKLVSQRYADAVKTNAGWMAVIRVNAEWNPNQNDFNEMQVKELESFTPQSAKEHFNKLFSLNRYTIITKEPAQK